MLTIHFIFRRTYRKILWPVQKQAGNEIKPFDKNIHVSTVQGQRKVFGTSFWKVLRNFVFEVYSMLFRLLMSKPNHETYIIKKNPVSLR